MMGRTLRMPPGPREDFPTLRQILTGLEFIFHHFSPRGFHTRKLTWWNDVHGFEELASWDGPGQHSPHSNSEDKNRAKFRSERTNNHLQSQDCLCPMCKMRPCRMCPMRAQASRKCRQLDADDQLMKVQLLWQGKGSPLKIKDKPSRLLDPIAENLRLYAKRLPHVASKTTREWLGYGSHHRIHCDVQDSNASIQIPPSFFESFDGCTRFQQTCCKCSWCTMSNPTTASYTFG